MRGTRNGVAVALAILGAFFVLLGAVMFYARTAIIDSESFANRATAALAEDEVQRALSRPIVIAIVDSGPAELINAQPIVDAAVSGMIGSGAFQDVFRQAVRNTHSTLFGGQADSLVLNLADAGIVAIEAVRSISPEIARQIPPEVEPDLVRLTESETAIDLAGLAHEVRSESIILPLLGLILLSASIALSPVRRYGFVRASTAVAVACGVGVVLLIVARSAVLGQFGDDTVHDAVAATWGAFLGDLVFWLVTLGAAAVILAAAAYAGVREVDPAAPLRAVRALGTWEPAAPVTRLLRASVLLAVGLVLVLRPEVGLYAIVIATGAWILFIAVTEILLVIAPPPAVPSGEAEAAGEGMLKRLRPGRAAGVVAGLAAVAVAVVVLTGGGDDAIAERPAGPVEHCNGFAELCDRPLDMVAFAGTHNSMSAAREPGWYLTNQRHGITRQLEDGIRVLLIDTHYGIESDDGHVVTDFSREGSTREAIVETTGEDGLERIERIRGRTIGDADSAQARPYLCHVACELGATELTEALVEVRDFLDGHPDEVVALMIEDVVPPDEVAEAFEDSGVLRYAYEHRRTDPLPTLREMIESDRRLLVMGETYSGGTALPWYHDGYALIQETPYTFNSPEEIFERASCRPNRGTAHSPVFQLNHWIEQIPRSPDVAEEVNSFDALMGRVRTCERLRGLSAGIIAVDHYDRGDIFEVIQVLNGLARDAEPETRTAG